MKDGLIFDRMLQASKGNKRQGVTIKKETGDTDVVMTVRGTKDHSFYWIFFL